MGTTVRKIVTCQLNAAQSSGPRSAEGRGKSAENARVHGLRARQGLMPWESMEEHAALRARLWAELAPVGWQEELLAESILRTCWQLEQRLPLYEVGVVSRHLAVTVNNQCAGEQYRGITHASISDECDACELDTDELLHLHATRLGAALIASLDSGKASAVVFLDNYRRSLERSLATTLDRLKQLQQERVTNERNP